jgi:anti-sigma factor RsiW
MSTDPHIIELIHADIDGTASESDLTELRQAITRDPSVRDEYRRLRGLQDLLARVEREDPPAHLAPAVMRSIRARSSAPTAGIWERIRRAFPAGSTTLRYAYAVAAGVIIGVVGVQWIGPGTHIVPGVTEREVSGTLAPPASGSFVDLAPAGIIGSVAVLPGPTGSEIGVNIGGTDAGEVVLKYDPASPRRVDVLVVRGGDTKPAGSLRLPRKE